MEQEAAATGQKQVVPAQWCLSVKQHNPEKASWAGRVGLEMKP